MHTAELRAGEEMQAWQPTPFQAEFGTRLKTNCGIDPPERDSVRPCKPLAIALALLSPVFNRLITVGRCTGISRLPTDGGRLNEPYASTATTGRAF